MALTPAQEAAVVQLLTVTNQFTITSLAAAAVTDLTAGTAIEVEIGTLPRHTTLANLATFINSQIQIEVLQGETALAFDPATTYNAVDGPKLVKYTPTGGVEGLYAYWNSTPSSGNIPTTPTHWYLVAENGAPGAAGTSATVAAGTATALAAGATPTVTNSGTTSAAVFNFGIPAGANGTDGTSATIAPGTITALAAGSAPTISNSGTASAAVFDFGIPAGADGNDGAAATIAPGTITALAPGATPTITNSGTTSAAVFDFGIPAGADGIATGDKVIYTTGAVAANGQIGGATTLSIHQNDRDGNQILGLAGLTSGSQIRIYDETNALNYQSWSITADLVLGGSVYSAAATNVSGGAIANATNARMLVIPAGPAGPAGSAVIVRFETTSSPAGDLNTIWWIIDEGRSAMWDPEANVGAGAWVDA